MSKPRMVIKSRTNTRDVSAEIIKMQHAPWAERTVGSPLSMPRPHTNVGHSMPDFEARRTRQGSILMTPTARQVLKAMEWMDRHGMGAAKFAQMASIP